MSIAAYYNFNADGNDSSGNGRNLTTTSLTFTGGKIGNAASFNGSTSQAVCAGFPQILTLTAAAWVKTSSPGSSYRAIVQQDSKWGLYLVNSVLQGLDQGGSGFHSTGVNIATGNWTHVALTCNSGVASGTKVYVNGSAVLTYTATIPTGTASLYVGSYPGQVINGLLDEVKIFNTVLSAAEVLALYNGSLANGRILTGGAFSSIGIKTGGSL